MISAPARAWASPALARSLSVSSLSTSPSLFSPTVAMARIFAEAEVGHDQHIVREPLLYLARGLLDDAVLVVGAAAHLVFLAGMPKRSTAGMERPTTSSTS